MGDGFIGLPPFCRGIEAIWRYFTPRTLLNLDDSRGRNQGERGSASRLAEMKLSFRILLADVNPGHLLTVS